MEGKKPTESESTSEVRIQSTKLLGGAQLYYIANIYPEKVTRMEAEDIPEWLRLSNDDKAYWNAGAKVIMSLCT